MSARHDYPLTRVENRTPAVTYEMDPAQWKDMCDEIDRLRAGRPHDWGHNGGICVRCGTYRQDDLNGRCPL